VTVKRELVLMKRFAGSAVVGDTAISPNGKLAVAGCGASIHLWDIAKGTEIRPIQGHKGNLQTLTFTKDSKQFLSCSRDGTVRLWDVASGNEVRRFDGHEGEVWAARISPDGKQVLTGCHDRKIRLFDFETATQQKVLIGHEDAVVCVEFAPDGRRALSCSPDKSVRLWDLGKGEQLESWTLPHQVRRVAWSHDGQRFAIALAAGGKNAPVNIEMIDLRTKKPVWSGERHGALVYGLGFTADDRFVVSSGWSIGGHHSVVFWDARKGKEVFRHNEDLGEIYDIELSPDGRYLLSNGGFSKAARLYRLPRSFWPVTKKGQRRRRRASDE